MKFEIYEPTEQSPEKVVRLKLIQDNAAEAAVAAVDANGEVLSFLFGLDYRGELLRFQRVSESLGFPLDCKRRIKLHISSLPDVGGKKPASVGPWKVQENLRNGSWLVKHSDPSKGVHLFSGTLKGEWQARAVADALNRVEAEEESP